eukprot:1152182-Pelagomonas_calceolata.AAC.6
MNCCIRSQSPRETQQLTFIEFARLVILDHGSVAAGKPTVDLKTTVVLRYRCSNLSAVSKSTSALNPMVV